MLTADGEVIQSQLGRSLAAFFPDVQVQECALKGDAGGECSGSKEDQLTISDEERDEKSGTLFSPMYQFFDNSGVCM